MATPPMGPKTRKIRSQLGVAKRLHPEDSEALTELRRQFGAARLEDYISETLATFPPLTEEQKALLTALLNGDQR